MGGGGKAFAFWIGKDFLQGTSAPSETFGNPSPLASGEEFVLKSVECWAFDQGMKGCAKTPQAMDSVNGDDMTIGNEAREETKRVELRQQAADALRFEAFS